MEYACLTCLKNNVQLFCEENNKANIFCGVPCQQLFRKIGRSVWIDLKRYTRPNTPPLILWNMIVKSNLTPPEIVADFFNYYNVPEEEIQEHNEQIQTMLRWLYNNQDFVKKNWKISFGDFLTYFVEYVITNMDSVAFMEFFINEIHIDPAMNNNFLIRIASKFGRTNIVRVLLQHPRVDPSVGNNYPIRKAVQDNHPAIVRLLLHHPRFNPYVGDNYAIKLAFQKGYLEIVRILLQDKRIDPSTEDNFGIKWASEDGHPELVRKLLQDKRVDPSAGDNYAIIWASFSGHAEIVRMLLQDKRVDPSADDNAAIRWAFPHRHTEVVRILLQDLRVISKLTPFWFEKLENEFPSLKDEIDAAHVSWSRLQSLEGEEQGEEEGRSKRVKEKIKPPF